MKYTLCKSYLSQIIGLMFSKKKNLLLIFNKEEKHPIHTLFVFFPVQIIWFDKNKKLIDFKKAYPFQPFISHKGKSKYILELTNFIDVKLGDSLESYINYP